MPRKTEFYLIPNKPEYRCSKITIIGKKPENRPYISVYAAGGHDLGTLNAADLERFAVNILKALGSKKLALSQRYNSKDFFKKKKNSTHG